MLRSTMDLHHPCLFITVTILLRLQSVISRHIIPTTLLRYIIPIQLHLITPHTHLWFMMKCLQIVLLKLLAQGVVEMASSFFCPILMAMAATEPVCR